MQNSVSCCFLQTVTSEGLRQTAVFGVLRSDYMLHTDYRREVDHNVTESKLLQVEINTIAAGMGPLCADITQMYKYFGRLDSAVCTDSEKTGRSLSWLPEIIPDNKGLEIVVDGIAAAHNHFVARCSPAKTQRKCVVAMIVQAAERNISDQRAIEYGTSDTFEMLLKLFSRLAYGRSAELARYRL
jgi:hypothetical protein